MSTMPFTSTASVDGIDLLDSLQQSLLNLRECWPAQWPGLALVFDRCLQRLGWSTAQASPRLQTLVNCAHEIAANIEGAARVLHAAEPAYHNRLHMADTMVCMTHLLLSQRRTQTTRQADACLECIALVVMLGHDYLHNGKVNRFPAELETIAVEQLTPIMAKHQVAQADQEMIAFCILKTDPSGVKQSHGLVAEREFVLEDRDCLAVLVQEADILGSTLPVTAPDLTASLASEWSLFNPQLAQSLSQPKSRIFFLENAALFSSTAAQNLGIPTLKATELDQIRAQIAASGQ
jgi:hypothetical protein